MNSSIKENIARILEEIQESTRKAGREEGEVKLMAAVKTVDPERIREAVQAGIRIIGENYVQEATRKKALLADLEPSPEWHMIGHLQINKAKYAVKLFDMIHSLGSMELARELDKRSRASGRVTKVLIEVNTGGESTKSGVPVTAAPDLIQAAAGLENISLVGLMTIPPWSPDPETARPYFASLRKIQEEIMGLHIPGLDLRELSMGMTDDYQVAIEEGATIVRIGRGIFGPRQT